MKWTWIGDSITEGLAPRLRTAYADRGDTSSIYGNVGWSTGKWIQEGNVAQLIASDRPDAVVVALGTNDEGSSKLGFLRNVNALIDKIGSGTKIIWIGPFNSQERNDWGKENVGIPWIDGMRLADGLPRSPDGVHFTVAGYKQLADRVLAAIEDLSRPLPPKRGIFWPFVLGLIAGGSVIASMWWVRQRSI